jgi:hypothetical protein
VSFLHVGGAIELRLPTPSLFVRVFVQAAAAMVPEQQLAAEAAQAVGAGGLNQGWLGHAAWMLGWAAVFLYVAVAKWLSVWEGGLRGAALFRSSCVPRLWPTFHNLLLSL